MPPRGRDVSKSEFGMDTGTNSSQLRRARGEIACAECRRLKTKCDRKIPCGPCTRRGCAAICPQGTLKAGAGTRYVLSNTEELHERMNEMSERIRELEQALEAEYGRSHPDSTHALLQADKLHVKDFLKPRVTPDPPDEHGGGQSSNRSPDAPGMLAVAPGGAMVQYVGRSAGPEALFMGGLAEELNELDGGISDELRDLSDGFLSGRSKDSITVAAAMTDLKAYLPSYEQARILISYCLDTGSLFIRPLRRSDLDNLVFRPVYDNLGGARGGGNLAPPLHPHRLGLMFAILAVGVSCNLRGPIKTPEGERYYHLARAALALKPLFVETTLDTIMALAFIYVYRYLTDQYYATMSNHFYISLTCMLAQNLGLHRDPERWHLSPDAVDVRRRVFWSLNVFDHLMCTLTGCATFFPNARVDCLLPKDDEITVDADGKVYPGLWNKRANMIHELFAPLNYMMTSATLPDYPTILEFDRKIRNYFTPPASSTSTANAGGSDKNATTSSRGKFTVIMSMPWLLLHLHRVFFARCCQEHPTDPDKSPYAASYFCAYKSSSILLQMLQKGCDQEFSYVVRFSHIWTISFSAALVIGSAIERGPNNSFAASGLIELAQAVDLFEKAAPFCARAQTALPYLTTLLRKAHNACDEYNRKGVITPAQRPVEGGQDVDLTMLTGQPIVFPLGRGSASPTSTPSPPGQPPAHESRTRTMSGLSHSTTPQATSFRPPFTATSSRLTSSWLPSSSSQLQNNPPTQPGPQAASYPAPYPTLRRQPSYTRHAEAAGSSRLAGPGMAPASTRSRDPQGRGYEMHGHPGPAEMSSVRVAGTGEGMSRAGPAPPQTYAGGSDHHQHVPRPTLNLEAAHWGGMSNLMGAVDSGMGMHPELGVNPQAQADAHRDWRRDGVERRSDDAVNLFGLEPVARHTQADDSWGQFVHGSGLIYVQDSQDPSHQHSTGDSQHGDYRYPPPHHGPPSR